MDYDVPCNKSPSSRSGLPKSVKPYKLAGQTQPNRKGRAHKLSKEAVSTIS
jgi:hypothetical protein